MELDEQAMTPERLQQLIAAHGAEPARWPEDERAAALSMAVDHASALEAGRALDRALDAWVAPPPSDALRRRVLGAAPATPPWARPGLWLSGAGLAAACAAGVVAGVGLIGPSLGAAALAGHTPSSGFMVDGLSVFGASLDAGAGR
jgi:hypothetical protein